jgi:short-subunit dehydrogenase
MKETSHTDSFEHGVLKRVLVIGASSGIGREVARLYAKEGHRVGVMGRRAELLEEIGSEFPGQIVTGRLDVREMTDTSCLEAIVGEMGGMDLCIYCSGIGTISRKLEWDIERDTTETNVSGFIRCAEWAFNRFAAQGGGQLANISSVASWRGNSHAPAYSASKAFQSVYFEGLKMKAGRLRIPVTVTDIQPGFVRTKMAQGNGQFWVAEVGKAARQIKAGIDRKAFRVYVTKRWRMVTWAMRVMPDFIYHRVS